jgi:hypothetical protein
MKVYENNVIRSYLNNCQYDLTRTKSNNTKYGFLKVVFLEIQYFHDVIVCRMVKRILVPLLLFAKKFKNIIHEPTWTALC